ncbi:MAG: hypothetical protein R3F50_05210 [Gammaproteobacteria bacterium]|jgi:hypothetical protein
MKKSGWMNCLQVRIRALRFLLCAMAVLTLSYCKPEVAGTQQAAEAVIDPMASDFFFMRNPEILEDLLEQLTIHGVEYWVNEDDSIGFYVKDTREVDRIANEAINVWITSQ